MTEELTTREERIISYLTYTRVKKPHTIDIEQLKLNDVECSVCGRLIRPILLLTECITE